MKIKLNRGPLKGNKYDVEDVTCRTYLVQEPVRKDYHDYKWDNTSPYATAFEYRRGTYEKSNVRLKDGTWVFEWMGWIE